MNKLSENERKEIIKSLHSKKASQRQLAKKFNVSKSTIQKIQQTRTIKLKNSRLKDWRIDSGVLKVFDNFRENRIPIIGTLLQQAA